MTFQQAVDYIIEREGGATVTDDPADPGGVTKYGISQRAYPSLDIVGLTREIAEGLYKLDYWDRVRGDELDARLALCVFDCAVNQGVERAVRFLQAAVGVGIDGDFGPVTMIAVKSSDPKLVIEQFQAERILHYAMLPTWGRFGRGWSRRAFGTVIAAYGSSP